MLLTADYHSFFLVGQCRKYSQYNSTTATVNSMPCQICTKTAMITCSASAQPPECEPHQPQLKPQSLGDVTVGKFLNTGSTHNRDIKTAMFLHSYLGLGWVWARRCVPWGDILPSKMSFFELERPVPTIFRAKCPSEGQIHGCPVILRVSRPSKSWRPSVPSLKYLGQMNGLDPLCPHQLPLWCNITPIKKYHYYVCPWWIFLVAHQPS